MPKKVDAKRPKPQEAENVNLYGQIPYYVLSRMPNITSFYALIEGKCQNEKGYCYTGTQYFADFFGVPTMTIKRWRKTLIEQGFIEIVRGYNRAKNETLGIKVVCRNATSNKDVTSNKDDTTTSNKDVTTTSNKDVTLVRTVSTYSKDNNIYANGICVNASCDDVQNNDTQNAKEAPTQKEASDTLELLFADWYSSYPKKKDKKRALSYFLKIMKLTGKKEKEAFGEYAGKPPAEKVAMMKQIATRQAEGKDTQYIPYPSTWLNGYRWQDETTNTAPTANTDIYTELYADEADNIPIQDI